MPFRVNVRLEGDKRFKRAIGKASSRSVAARSLRKIGAKVQRTIVTDFLSGQALDRRTGRLARSISVDRSRIPESVGVGSPLARALAHEEGATIRPKRARVLTIPLDAAKTAAGVARFTARGAARQYESTFWQESRRGNLILFGTRGNRLVPLFLGRKQVRLPERPFIEPSLRQEIPFMERTWAAEAEREVGGA